MKRTLIISVLITAVLAVSMQKSPTFTPFRWMVGTWKLKSQASYETWKINTDYTLTGESYTMNDNAHQVIETMRIVRQDTAYYFYASGSGKNNSKEIPFRIIAMNDTSLAAINPQNSFPKMIRYRIVHDSILRASISGDSTQRTVVYDYVRIRMKR